MTDIDIDLTGNGRKPGNQVRVGASSRELFRLFFIDERVVGRERAAFGDVEIAVCAERPLGH